MFLTILTALIWLRGGGGEAGSTHNRLTTQSSLTAGCGRQSWVGGGGTFGAEQLCKCRGGGFLGTTVRRLAVHLCWVPGGGGSGRTHNS